MLPPRIPLARLNTPLHLLARFSEKLKSAYPDAPRIWLKRDDLTGFALSGNKVRKLEFTLAEARSQGCDTVITCGGVQSNHCRATAIACAQLGLKCHLLLRGESVPAEHADGNIFIDQLAGATIAFHSVSDYQKNLNELLLSAQDEVARSGGKAFIIPTGASDEIGIWGYVAACEELKHDFAKSGITPGHVFCATGSGGTQAGLTLGAYRSQLNTQVWGINVCDDENYFLHKVNEDITACVARYGDRYDLGKAIHTAHKDLPIKVIDGYVGPGYAKATAEIFDLIKEFASQEGVIFDPVYTGKAFYGLLSEIKKGRFDAEQDVVFIHTGGAFGLFAQRHCFYSKTQ